MRLRNPNPKKLKSPYLSDKDEAVSIPVTATTAINLHVPSVNFGMATNVITPPQNKLIEVIHIDVRQNTSSWYSHTLNRNYVPYLWASHNGIRENICCLVKLYWEKFHESTCYMHVNYSWPTEQYLLQNEFTAAASMYGCFPIFNSFRLDSIWFKNYQTCLLTAEYIVVNSFGVTERIVMEINPEGANVKVYQ